MNFASTGNVARVNGGTIIRSVFLAGTSNAKKAEAYADVALAIGQGIAEAGLDLTTGPGTGISKYAITGFKSINKHGVLRAYLPDRAAMKLAGEELSAEFDEIVETDLDYPMRNVFHIQQSDALIVITGGDGTLEECLPAVVDYAMPTVVFKDSGLAPKALHWLANQLFPNWLKYLHFVESVDAAMEIISNLNAESHSQR